MPCWTVSLKSKIVNKQKELNVIEGHNFDNSQQLEMNNIFECWLPLEATKLWEEKAVAWIINSLLLLMSSHIHWITMESLEERHSLRKSAQEEKYFKSLVCTTWNEDVENEWLLELGNVIEIWNVWIVC